MSSLPNQFLIDRRTGVPRWAAALRGFLPRDVVIAFVLTRLALVVVGFAAPLIVSRPSGFGDLGSIALLNIWSRWDGQIYVAIAQHGYFLRDQSPVTAFFPLYPFVLQLATLWSQSRELIASAGLLISNVALLVALAYVVAIGRLDFDDATGRRAAIYYLIAPTTLFLSAVFTESLFLALLLGSFYHARRGQLALAGVLGFLCALARPYGILLVVPIAWEAFRRRKVPIAAIGPMLGPPVFFGYLWLQFGDPFLWFKAQEAWRRHIDFPWHGFVRYLELPSSWWFPPTLTRVDLIAAIGLVLLAAIALWRLPRVYGVFGALSVVVMLSATHFQSMTRWALGVFPIFFLLALWGRNRWVNFAIIGASFAIALYFMARFSQWQWVA